MSPEAFFRGLLAKAGVTIDGDQPWDLQVRDPHGKWVTVVADMGLPSGTNRTMRVDLTGKFLSSDRHVRIVTGHAIAGAIEAGNGLVLVDIAPIPGWSGV